jgi:hypothetical protein
MKIWVSLLGLSLCSLTAFAQPTSFGGITPGKTSRDELKSLVEKSDNVGAKNDISVELKHPEGQRATVRLQNDVVYEVEVSLTLQPELKSAVMEKYGQPKIKVGAIRKVTCGNKLGASFERLEGEEERRWPVKDGVQGAINRLAGVCAELIYEDYVLRHVATVKAIDSYKAEQAKKEADERRRKLGDSF